MAHRAVMSFAQLHPFAVEELRQARQGARRRQLLRVVLGEDVPSTSWIDSLTARYHQAVDAAEDLASRAMHAPGEYVRAEAERASATFWGLADEAREHGLSAVSEAATVASASIREWGQGFGEGFRAFWGVSPGLVLAGGGVLAALAIGGGGYLLLTGGGQALLTGAGTALAGAGKALLKAI